MKTRLLYVLTALLILVTLIGPRATVVQAGSGTYQVAASLDDTYAKVGGNNYPTANNVYVRISTETDWGGTRFSLPIPQGSTIDTATLSINITSTTYDDAYCTIMCEATDNAQDYTSTNTHIDLRTYTSANVSWAASGIGAGAKSTPELKTIIQEVINRAGWVSGNYLSIIMKPETSCSMSFTSRDVSSGSGAVLSIQWTSSSDVPVVTSSNATSVEETTATLNGTCDNVTKTITEIGFEWDTDSGAPYSTNWTETGTSYNGTTTHDISSLTQGELYYFRAMAYNTNGWGYGTEYSFLTKPEAPSGLTVTGYGGTWVALSWTAGTGAQTYRVRYSSVDYPATPTDGSSGYSGASTSCNVTGLLGATTYYFRVWSYATESSLYQYSDSYDSTSQLTNPANDTIVGTITAVSTVECSGITATFTQDDNENNTATLEYRATGATTWLATYDMVCDRTNREYRGSIFWLSPNTSYDVRVTFADVDGIVGTNPVVSTFTTLNDSPAIGTNYIFVATTGNDTTGDGTIGNPYLTIGKAASLTNPGDTVEIRTGTYNETVTITRSGNATSWITYRNYNGESVTLDGTTGSLTRLMYVNAASYIRIRGLTVQNSVGSGENGSGIEFNGASYGIAENCTAINTGRGATGTNCGGIVIKGSSTNIIAQYNTVTLNQHDVAGRLSGIILNHAGNSIVVRYNTVSSNDTAILQDAIGNYPEDTSTETNNWDVYSNNVWGMYDDGIQLDGAGENVRIWSNNVTGGTCSISFCPVRIGPLYCFRNLLLSASNGAFKLGDESAGLSGQKFLFHNTCSTLTGLAETDTSLGGIYAMNNVLLAGRYVYEMGTQIAPANLMDYNNVYTTDATRFTKWSGGATYNTFALHQANTGQDLNSISYDTTDSDFTNAAGGDYTLQAGSPLRNVGVVLMQFNDATSPWPYLGAAPDIGAYEYTESPPVIVTSDVTSLAFTSAGVSSGFFNGEVTSMGGEASVVVYFQYGLTVGYGSVSSNTTVSGIGTFQIALPTNLVPGSTYHARAACNVTSGNDIVFTLTMPTITTQSATSIAMTAGGVTSGNFKANISDMGKASSAAVHFVYGPTVAYGSSSSTLTPVAAGDVLIGIPAALTPGATYHYKVVLECGATSSNGTDQTFTLTMPTPTVGTVIGTNIAGMVTSMGVATSTSAYFDYGPTNAYGFTTPAQLVSGTGIVSSPASSMGVGSTVYFRLNLTNGATTITSAGTSEVLSYTSTVGIITWMIPSVFAVASIVVLLIVIAGGGADFRVVIAAILSAILSIIAVGVLASLAGSV